MVRLTRMKPVLKLISKCCICPVARQRKRRHISILGKLLLFLSQSLLSAQKLKLIQILIQSSKRSHIRLVYVSLLHSNSLVGRIVYYILQHIILLSKHRIGIVILHAKILKVHVHTLHIHTKGHVIIVESLCNIAQLLQSFYVVLDNAYLLLSVLRKIIHLAYLHYQVLLCLRVRKIVDLVECLGNVQGSKSRLTI